MSADELVEAVTEFAHEVLGDDMLMTVALAVSAEFPTAAGAELAPARPLFNRRVTVRLRRRDSDAGGPEVYARRLRDAVEEDPWLGGRIVDPVHLLPASVASEAKRRLDVNSTTDSRACRLSAASSRRSSRDRRAY